MACSRRLRRCCAVQTQLIANKTQPSAATPIRMYTRYSVGKMGPGVVAAFVTTLVAILVVWWSMLLKEVVLACVMYWLVLLKEVVLACVKCWLLVVTTDDETIVGYNAVDKFVLMEILVDISLKKAQSHKLKIGQTYFASKIFFSNLCLIFSHQDQLSFASCKEQFKQPLVNNYCGFWSRPIK